MSLKILKETEIHRLLQSEESVTKNRQKGQLNKSPMQDWLILTRDG